MANIDFTLIEEPIEFSTSDSTEFSVEDSVQITQAGFAVGDLTLATGPDGIGGLVLTGHSYMDPAGVGILTSPGSKYATGARIATALGVPQYQCVNIAKSGAALRSHLNHGTAYVLQQIDPGKADYLPQIPKIGMAINWFGTNDMALWGTTASMVAGYKGGVRAVTSRERAVAVWDYNDTTVSKIGTWTAVDYSAETAPWGSGQGCWESSTPGDTVTITLPTDLFQDVDGLWIALGFVCAYDGAVFSVELDGVAQGTISTGDHHVATDLGGTDVRYVRNGDVFRLYAPAGSEEIVITLDSLVHAGPGRFDYWQIEATPENPVLWLENTMPTDPSWVWGNIDQTLVDTYNTYLSSVLAEFTGGAVRRVTGLDAALLGGTGVYDYYSHDGLHPNDRGAMLTAQVVTEHVRLALASGDIQRHQIVGYYSGEDTPVTSTDLRILEGNGSPAELVDNFDRSDAIVPGGSWVSSFGGWGVYQKQLALRTDRWQAPAFEDEFGRQDSTTTVGNGWTVLSGTWGILTGKLRLYTTGSTSRIFSPQSLNAGNGYVGFTVGTCVDNAGIVFRYQDASNYWYMVESSTYGSWVLSKVVAGATTVVQNGSLGSSAAGSKLHIELDGNDITVFINGAQTWTGTDSALATATGVGLTGYSGNPQFDDFVVNTTATDFTNDPGFNFVSEDLGSVDGTIRFEVGQDTSNFNGCIVRYQGPNDYVKFYESVTYGSWVLVKYVAGVYTLIQNGSMGTCAAGTEVALSLSGDNITVNVAGTDYGPYSIAGTAGTAYGFCVSYGVATPMAAFDNIYAGVSSVIVNDGQFYFDLLTGTLHGPFVDGAAVSSVVVWPTAAGVGLGNVDNTSDATKNAAAVTLTNKRITRRVGTVASSATPSINTDNVDTFSITALATAITSMTTNLTGTPTNFQSLIIRIKDDGTARAITWGASFASMGATLPTTTVLGKVLTVGFLWDAVAAKWSCVATAQEA